MTNINTIVKTRNDLDVFLNSYKQMFARFPNLQNHRFVYTSAVTDLYSPTEWSYS